MHRRDFLGGAATGLVVGAGATYGLMQSDKKPAQMAQAPAPTPAPAPAAPAVMPSATTWRFQSTWPARDIFHEFAQDYVKRVNEMAGSRFKLELLPAGAVVGAFQVMDATHSGALDGAHGVTVYWYGKSKVASLFGTTAPFGWDANQLLGWFYHGGGEAFYNELIRDVLKLNIVGFLTGPMPTQPLGWFKNEIKSAADFRGMKYRTVGLSADIFNAMGASVVSLPGGEIVPAIDRGLIEGAEFNNPSSDKLLGFPDVAKNYMVGSYHQRMECFEILFNRQKYDALPPELRAILRYASEAESADMSWKQQDRYSKDLAEIKKAGVKVTRTPDSVLQGQLNTWTRLIEENSAKDPFFKKVVESQKAWVERVVGFYREYDTPNDMAWNHFFKKS
jgi:TRAP-type mannitol/chloroaromatic compound transport system substrate-binding protein